MPLKDAQLLPAQHPLRNEKPGSHGCRQSFDFILYPHISQARPRYCIKSSRGMLFSAARMSLQATIFPCAFTRICGRAHEKYEAPELHASLPVRLCRRLSSSLFTGNASLKDYFLLPRNIYD
ncbi:MAG: hypothetical protein K2N94_06535, partial [Lachnospiraceae bacterium]|nr:hypothetical protein [Lachnospiraceae bacterium]